MSVERSTTHHHDKSIKRVPYAFSESQIDHLFALSSLMRDERAYRKEIGFDIARLFADGIRKRHPNKKFDFNLSLWRGADEYLHYRSRNTLAMDFPQREGFVYAQVHDVLQTGTFSDIFELEQYVQYGGGYASKLEKPQRFLARTFYELQALTNDMKKARAVGNVTMATAIQEIKTQLIIDRILTQPPAVTSQSDLQIQLHHDATGLPERDKLVFSLVDTNQGNRIYATTPPPAYLFDPVIKEKYTAALRPLGINAYGQMSTLQFQ